MTKGRKGGIDFYWRKSYNYGAYYIAWTDDKELNLIPLIQLFYNLGIRCYIANGNSTLSASASSQFWYINHAESYYKPNAPVFI